MIIISVITQKQPFISRGLAPDPQFLSPHYPRVPVKTWETGVKDLSPPQRSN
jgi:hypothetical protein